MEISCWNCKHFERVRMWAYCHGGKKTYKLPQKAWYSGNIKFCTNFSPKNHAPTIIEGSDIDGKTN